MTSSNTDITRHELSKAGDTSVARSILRITKQPPSYVFPNECFEVELILTELPSLPSLDTLTLQATLEHQQQLTSTSTSNKCDGNVAKLAIDPSTPLETLLSQQHEHQQKPLSMLVKCKVESGCTIPTDRELKVIINFSLQQSTSLVSSVFTTPIQLVNYKFSVEEETTATKNYEEGTTRSSGVHVWYKDEGGRDKSMLAQVNLIGHDDKVDALAQQQQDIPFRIILQYADHAHADECIVRNQDILRVFGHSKHYIDSDKRKALIRYRIDEVSKSHQGHTFRLEIVADGRFDIAPVCTRPVSVRSKRNKRQRLSLAAAAPSSTATRASDEATPLAKVAAAAAVFISPPMDNTPPSALAISLQQQKHSKSSAASTTTQTSISSSSANPVALEVSKIKESWSRIHNWADIVVNNLTSMQWKVIGYATKSDGTVDFNHPYYDMPNPNSSISNLLAMYSNSTRDDICYVLSALESTLAQNEKYSISTNISSDYSAAADDHQSISTAAPAAATATPAALHRSFAGVDTTTATDALAVITADPISLSSAFDRARKDTEESLLEIQKTVMYVLARHYKAFRTGKPLGFPAFNSARELIGFFQETPSTSSMEMFIPISWLKHDFGPLEKEQASQILNVAIEYRIGAVHCMTDCDSISSLLKKCFRFAMSSSSSSSSAVYRSEQQP